MPSPDFKSLSASIYGISTPAEIDLEWLPKFLLNLESFLENGGVISDESAVTPPPTQGVPFHIPYLGTWDAKMLTSKLSRYTGLSLSSIISYATFLEREQALNMKFKEALRITKQYYSIPDAHTIALNGSTHIPLSERIFYIKITNRQEAYSIYDINTARRFNSSVSFGLPALFPVLLIVEVSYPSSYKVRDLFDYSLAISCLKGDKTFFLEDYLLA